MKVFVNDGAILDTCVDIAQQESSRFRRESLTTCELQRNGLLTKHISAPNGSWVGKIGKLCGVREQFCRRNPNRLSEDALRNRHSPSRPANGIAIVMFQLGIAECGKHGDCLLAVH